MPPVLDTTANQPASRRLTAWSVLVVMALLLSACGSSDLNEDPDGDTQTTVDDGPRVADRRFDGEFTASAIAVGGVDVALGTDPIVIIETEFGSLTLNPGCNTYFGSFSLLEDGAASFTIAGGSQQDCGDLAAQEDAVLAAFGGVDSWATIDGGFRFDGPNGDAIVLRGP